MSTPPSHPVAAAVAAAAVAALLAGAPAAGAAPAHHPTRHATKHASKQTARHATKHTAKHARKQAKPRPFTAHGIVVSHAGPSVTVLARQLRVGGQVTQNRRLVLRMATAAAVPADGSQVTLTGKVSGSGDAVSFTGRAVAEHAAETHVYLGTVVAVNGSVVTVDKGATPGDDPTDNGEGTFTVDVSTASVSVDGAAGALAVGQSVAVLGTDDHDAVVASAVWAFSTAPATVTGEVTAVTGTVVTVAGENDTSTDIDLAATSLVVDGAPGTPDQVVVGSRVTALTITDATGATSTLALAVTPGDHNGDHGGDGSGTGSGD